MEQEKEVNCPICNYINEIEKQIIHVVGKTKRLRCLQCGCIFFENNNYNKPKYNIEYNMHFFRGSDIRKAGLVAYELDEILERKTREKKILEIGTGNGILTFLLKNIGYDVTAVEIDERLCDYLTKTMNIKMLAGEFEKIELKEKYDLIYSSHVIEHIIKPYDFLIKAMNSLNVKGLLYLDTPNAYYQTKFGLYWRHFITRNKFEHCTILSPKSAEIMANKLGLKIMTIRENPHYESMEIILKKEQ